MTIKRESEKYYVEDLAGGALSEREAEVLRYASFGLSIQQTADNMDISFNTTKNHRASILVKLGAKDIIHAVIIGLADSKLKLEEAIEGLDLQKYFKLSARHREFLMQYLNYASEGYSRKEIARKLSCERQSLSNIFTQNIFPTLGVSCEMQALLLCYAIKTMNITEQNPVSA